MRTELTQGQQRVRELALKVLDECKDFRVLERKKFGASSLYHYLIYDQIISSDPVAGATFETLDMSNTYAKWLVENERNWQSISDFNHIDVYLNYNKIIFRGRLISYSGYKPDLRLIKSSGYSTICDVILALVAGENISPHTMRYSYYINSGLLFANGGNHRLAAFKLTGLTNFPEGVFTYYNDNYNDEVNNLLTRLENLFQLKEYGIDYNLNSMPDCINDEIVSFFERNPKVVHKINSIAASKGTNKISLYGLKKVYEEYNSYPDFKVIREFVFFKKEIQFDKFEEITNYIIKNFKLLIED